MGEALSKLFVPLHSLPGLYDLPAECVEPQFDAEAHLHATFGGLVQLAFLAFAYGFVLFQASNLIAEGSELLLLIPEIAPIVGSVVIPILGAVPDGAVVLFSGLGDKAKAQKQLSVGVGALAGSTIMLLTVPWFLSVFAGRVTIEDGRCRYSRPAGAGPEWKKLVPGTPLSKSGVEADHKALKAGGQVVLLTSVSYFVIQGAAFAYQDDATDADVARDERTFALVGLVLCTVLFFWYLYTQVSNSGSDAVLQDFIDRKREAALKSGMLSLQGAFFNALDEYSASSETHLLDGDAKQQRFKHLVRKFFSQYDVNGDNSIDKHELKLLLVDLHIPHRDEDVERFLREMDADGNGNIHFGEFVSAMLHLVQETKAGARNPLGTSRRGLSHQSSDEALQRLMQHHESEGEQVQQTIQSRQQELQRVISADVGGASGGDGSSAGYGSLNSGPREGGGNGAGAGAAAQVEGEEEEEEEEEEDVPEDLADLPPDVQQRRILLRSLRMMLTGTALVLVFSDPMVDVMSEIGVVCGISSFYISFILAPLASNASELIASYSYALKKTSKTITISLTALTGAAIMNNTFCLGIFLALVYFRGLAWEFSAETISILFVELCVSLVAMRRVQTLPSAVFVLSLFPLSLLVVFVLENVFHFD